MTVFWGSQGKIPYFGGLGQDSGSAGRAGFVGFWEGLSGLSDFRGLTDVESSWRHYFLYRRIEFRLRILAEMVKKLPSDFQGKLFLERFFHGSGGVGVWIPTCSSILGGLRGVGGHCTL